MLSKTIRVLLTVSLVCGIFTLGMIFTVYRLQDPLSAGFILYEEKAKCEAKHRVQCRAQMVPKQPRKQEYRL